MEPDVFWAEPLFDSNESAGGFLGRPPPGTQKCALLPADQPVSVLKTFYRFFRKHFVTRSPTCCNRKPNELILNDARSELKLCHFGPGARSESAFLELAGNSFAQC